jgi:hypothetical protein
MTEASEKIEAEVLFELHELSMGNDAYNAAFARLAKEVIPVYARTIAAEFERGTDAPELAYRTTLLMVGMSLTLMSGVAVEDRIKTADVIIDFFSKVLRELAASKNIFASDKANG